MQVPFVKCESDVKYETCGYDCCVDCHREPEGENMFNALQLTAIISQGSIACASITNSNINRDNTIQETVEAAIVILIR